MSMDPKDWHRKQRNGPDWRLCRTSQESKDLCEKMLTFSDKDRPSMKQCLTHEYFLTAHRSLGKVVGSTQFAELNRFCELSELSRSMLVELAGRLPMEKAEKIAQV